MTTTPNPPSNFESERNAAAKKDCPADQHFWLKGANWARTFTLAEEFKRGERLTRTLLEAELSAWKDVAETRGKNYDEAKEEIARLKAEVDKLQFYKDNTEPTMAKLLSAKDEVLKSLELTELVGHAIIVSAYLDPHALAIGDVNKAIERLDGSIKAFQKKFAGSV